MTQYFWAITVFFNPAEYKNKLENYKKFRDSLKKQGLKILVVELAFENRQFELIKNDADILIQIRTNGNNVLWQKEALLNIGLKNLPEECDKFCWLDCDIIFEDDDWIKKASKLLDKYDTVQLFSHIVMLKKDEPILPKGINKSNRLFECDNYYSKKRVLQGTVYSTLLSNSALRRPFSKPGGAWASRKSIIEKFGFYDRTILGGGDCLMLAGLYSGVLGNKNTKEQYMKSLLPVKNFSDYNSWYKKSSEIIRGNVYYLNGFIFHLWHGERKNRFYEARQIILKEYDFDHVKDIEKDENGVWKWASNKKMLHEVVKKYFFMRNETGFSSWKGFFEFLRGSQKSFYFWRENMFPIYIKMKIRCLRADIKRKLRFLEKLFNKIYFNIIKVENRNVIFTSIEKKVYVCTSVDMNQVRYFPTMANSISKNTKSHVVLYLLARDFSEEVKDAILSLNLPKITIKIIEMDEYFKDVDFRLPRLICHTSKSAMDRNLLPSILPEINKIIYLDIDLVVNEDLTALYNMETSKKGICAKSCVSHRYKTMERQVKEWGIKKENVINCLLPRKIKLNVKCFNSGVMVLDLEKLRKNNFEQMSRFLIKNFIFSFHDQLLFNIYTGGDYKELPGSWNIFVGQSEPHIKNIIHWVGPKKPWKKRVIWKKYWNKYYLPLKIKKKQKLISPPRKIFAVENKGTYLYSEKNEF